MCKISTPFCRTSAQPLNLIRRRPHNVVSPKLRAAAEPVLFVSHSVRGGEARSTKLRALARKTNPAISERRKETLRFTKHGCCLRLWHMAALCGWQLPLRTHSGIVAHIVVCCHCGWSLLVCHCAGFIGKCLNSSNGVVRSIATQGVHVYTQNAGQNAEHCAFCVRDFVR